MSKLQKLLRAGAVRALTGYGRSEFYAAQQDGRFPKPDGFLGPRSPVWREETVAAWQQALVGKPGDRLQQEAA